MSLNATEIDLCFKENLTIAAVASGPWLTQRTGVYLQQHHSQTHQRLSCFPPRLPAAWDSVLGAQGLPSLTLPTPRSSPISPTSLVLQLIHSRPFSEYMPCGPASTFAHCGLSPSPRPRLGYCSSASLCSSLLNLLFQATQERPLTSEGF